MKNVIDFQEYKKKHCKHRLVEFALDYSGVIIRCVDCKEYNPSVYGKRKPVVFEIPPEHINCPCSFTPLEDF